MNKDLLSKIEQLVEATEKEVRDLHSHTVIYVKPHTHQLDWNMYKVQSLNQLSKDIQALTQTIVALSGVDFENRVCDAVGKRINDFILNNPEE